MGDHSRDIYAVPKGGEKILDWTLHLLPPEHRVSMCVSGLYLYFSFSNQRVRSRERPVMVIYRSARYMKMLTNGQLNFQPGIKRALGGGKWGDYCLNIRVRKDREMPKRSIWDV